MSKVKLAGASIAAFLTLPSVSMAQTAPAAPAELETVVVTAEKRSENVQDVPISISAVSGKQLHDAGITSTNQLSTVVPGLNFVVQGAYAQPTIRGIGTTVTGAGADANVSLYVDGVYQPSQLGNVFSLNDVQDIEVLKGPQGTLFGRNATGGAVTITTKTPVFDTSGFVDAGYGSFGQVRGGGYITTGITSDIAADLSVNYSQDDGYVRNITLNKDAGKQGSLDIRSKILYNVTDDLSFVLAGGYMRNRDDAIYLTKPINGNNINASHPGVTFPADPYEINTDTPTRALATDAFANLTGHYELGNGTITTITSYQSLTANLYYDADTTELPLSSSLTLVPEHTFSQEANFNSEFSGPVNFIAGIYYYWDSSTRTSPTTAGVGGPTTLDYTVNVTTQAEALYGQLYWDILSDLRLTGGLRYSNERKEANGAYAVGPATQLHSAHTWDAFTPSASLRWKIDDNQTTYVSYNRGFKSGSYNTTTLAQQQPVDPEFVDAYEAGYKFSDNHISANLAAYYYDYSNIQVAVQTNINGTNTGVLQNAATAQIYGLDGDVTAVLDDNWQAEAGASYIHARYTDFPNALVTTPIMGGGNTQTPMDVSGNDMVRTPTFTGNLTLSYNADLFGGEFEASATGSYNSGFYWDPGNRVKQNAYGLLNTNISWSPPNSDMKFELWTTNLTDTKYYYYVSASTTGTSGSLQRPRSVGVLVTRSF
jgi:iron complex outermembrane recepter protein